jgi:CubicO group peptidase (beta-lactamase class C family)
MKKYLFLLLLLAVTVTTVFSQKKKTSLKDSIAVFDAYIQNAMKDWRVPGMSVAIVKNNQIVFTKGYGVREITTDKKVDTKTYFSCASTTKAMTAVCMGILVDEGKVSWNDPVINYLPQLKLYDAYVTNELRIRDLFIHNSGVGNADFLWSDNILNADEILAKMKLVKPSYSFRSSFIYQNIFYLIAGKVITKITGKPWDIYVKEKIFDPLKMNHTKALLSEVHDENATKPHFLVDDKIMVIPKDSADVIAPAGSVTSCADDIALWMQCMIDSSKYAGGRLVKPETWKYLLKPQTLVTESEFYPTQYLTKPNFMTYGMGWFQQDYKGYKINFHTGSLNGATAIHAQLPDKKFGIYVFGNLDHAELRHALIFKALDYFELGGERDWSTDFLHLYDSIKAEGKKREAQFAPKQIANTKPSLSLEKYTGHYENELFGFIDVTLHDGKLKAVINSKLNADLEHFHFDTFKAEYERKWYGKDLVLFQLGADGTVSGISSDGVIFNKTK